MKLIKKLNKLIHFDCIYGLAGEVLYENISGTTGTNSITLNKSIANFKRLKVVYDFCVTPGTRYGYGNMEEIDTTRNLTNFIVGKTINTTSWASISITDKVLKITRNRFTRTDGTMVDGNYIYIVKVIGYKY